MNVLRRIDNAVRGQLRLVLSGRVPADLNEVTCDVVAAVASIIDGSAEVEEGGMPVIPMLGFCRDRWARRTHFRAAGLWFVDARVRLLAASHTE
jgi:hypothetical protein